MNLKACILIVDDDASVRRGLRRLLRAYAYEVMEADAIPGALELMDSRLPDVLVLDMVMPGEDSLDLARRLKSDPRRAALPIIALTASPPTAASDRTLFNAVLLKPCDGHAFVQEIEKALAQGGVSAATR